MTATETRIPLAQAEELADDVVALLRPYCERIAVGGSIRRRRPMVKDIEVVAIPQLTRIQADLFGQEHETIDELDRHVRCLITGGTFSTRLDVNGRPRLGLKTKLLSYRGFAVDVFTATPGNWGWIYLLRTGPSDFNERIVTQWHAGGTVMPFGMRSHDGWLWRGDNRIETPEEIDAFNALGLGWIAPEERR